MKRLLWAAACSLVLATAAQAQDRMRIVRNMVIEQGETAAGDATCFGCSIRVGGALMGDAVAVGGDIEIEGNVAGDAVAVGGGVWLGPAANLAGDAVALGGPVKKDATAHLAGLQVPLPWAFVPGQRHLYLRGVAAWAGILLAGFLIFYAIARQRRVENMAGTFAGRPVWSLLIGLGVMAVASLLYAWADTLKRRADPIESGITVVLMIVFGLGYVGLSCWLGHKLLRESAPLAAGLVGAVVWLALQFIPLVGFVVFILLFVLGSGCAALSGFGGVRRGASPA